MHRSLPALSALALCLLVSSGCIHAPVHVEAFPESGPDFSSARTFAYEPPEFVDPKVGAVIEEEILETLAGRGLTMAPPEQADLLVTHRTTWVRVLRTYTDGDIDASWRTTEPWVEKVVEVRVLDPRTREVLWRGVGEVEAHASVQKGAARKATREVLAAFPANPGLGNPGGSAR